MLIRNDVAHAHEQYGIVIYARIAQILIEFNYLILTSKHNDLLRVVCILYNYYKLPSTFCQPLVK